MEDAKRLGIVLFVFVFTLLPPDCVYGGLKTHDCTRGLDDIGSVLDAAMRLWPEVELLRERLDIICEPPEDIASSCLSPDAVACSVRAGNDFNRAVVRIDDTAPVDVLLGHELLHLVAFEQGISDGCYDHGPDCWDWDAVKTLQDIGTDVGDCVRDECAYEQEDGSVQFSQTGAGRSRHGF